MDDGAGAYPGSSLRSRGLVYGSRCLRRFSPFQASCHETIACGYLVSRWDTNPKKVRISYWVVVQARFEIVSNSDPLQEAHGASRRPR